MIVCQLLKAGLWYCRGRLNRWPVASRFAVGPVILRTGWPVGSMNVNGPVILYTCNSLIIFVPISYFERASRFQSSINFFWASQFL